MSVERNYHLMFTHIHLKTLDAIKEVVKKGLWRVDQPEGFDLVRWLYRKISTVYSISVPSLVVADYEHYKPYSEEVGLPKVSLVSCLHEYRHHMQHHNTKQYDDIEIDARAWSISAFHCALPKSFNSAWKRGMIWFLPPYED